jgi:hypothetical protein
MEVGLPGGLEIRESSGAAYGFLRDECKFGG